MSNQLVCHPALWKGCVFLCIWSPEVLQTLWQLLTWMSQWASCAILGCRTFRDPKQGLFFFLIKLLLAALVLIAACRLSLVARSRGYSLAEVCRLLIAVISLVELGL